jgi:H+/Cl- antiporter ClcA
LKQKKQQVVFVLICGLAVALPGFIPSKEMIGSGKSVLIGILFTSDKYLPWYAPLIRMTGSIFSFSAGAAGGIFAPALSSGA